MSNGARVLRRSQRGKALSLRNNSTDSAGQPSVDVIDIDALSAQLADSARVASMETKRRERTGSHSRRMGTYICGAVVSVLIHVVLLGSITLGAPARKVPKPQTESAAFVSRQEHEGEVVTTLLILNDSSITPPDQDDDFTTYATAAADQALPAAMLMSSDAIRNPQLNLEEAKDGEDESAKAVIADTAGLSELFGRYMGQVKARIERAWTYPTKGSRKSNRMSTAECRKSCFSIALRIRSGSVRSCRLSSKHHRCPRRRTREYFRR
jgi:hypothetical protein